MPAQQQFGQGLGYEIDVVSPSLVRVRGANKPAIELRFEGGWSVRPASAALRQDALLARLGALGAAFRPFKSFVSDDATFVVGLLKGRSSSDRVLVSDKPVTTSCP